LWKQYRYQSAEKVFEEIYFLAKEYKSSNFEIVDSTFNGNMDRIDKLCECIIRSKLTISWSAKATFRKEMSFSLLQKMRKAGCMDLSYGVESGSPRVLHDMRKNIDLTQIKRIIKDTWKSGIRVNCFFLIGYPIETEDDFKLTLDFVKENAHYICRFDQITGCHIEEDSYLGRHSDDYKIVFKSDGWYSPHSSPQIRGERLQRFKELACRLHRNYDVEVQS
jgi:tRNA A37 methylthiotransferase MiaB